MISLFVFKIIQNPYYKALIMIYFVDKPQNFDFSLSLLFAIWVIFNDFNCYHFILILQILCLKNKTKDAFAYLFDKFIPIIQDRRWFENLHQHFCRSYALLLSVLLSFLLNSFVSIEEIESHLLQEVRALFLIYNFKQIFFVCVSTVNWILDYLTK